MSRTLLVQTMSLNTLIDEDAWTYVSVGDQYVRKKARDLARGDAVVVMNEHISKTLPDVEGELRMSLRYALAEDRLNPMNGEGKRIPAFRALLLRGLAAGDAGGASLEKRIMMEEGRDFSDADYSGYAERVLALVQGVGSAAVSRWLRPDSQGAYTLAPRDWENFLRLSPLNPEFIQIYESKGSEAGFHADYALYVGVRRTVMRHLAQKGGSSSMQQAESPESDTGPQVQGKYAAEIGFVVRRFMSEITARHSTSMVMGVREVKEGKKRQLAAVQDDHLSTGIATSFNGKTVDMELIRERQYIANHALATALFRYFSSKTHAGQGALEKELLQYVAPDYAKNMLTSRLQVEKDYEEGIFLGACKRLGIVAEEARSVLQGAYDRFMEDMRDGRVDEALGLPAHTVASLIDATNMLKRTLPRQYHEMVVLSTLRHDNAVKAAHGGQGGHVSETGRSDDSLRKDLLARERYLNQTYCMKPNKELKWLLLQCHDGHMQQGRAPVAGRDYASVARSRQGYEKAGFTFYSAREVQAHMEAMGMLSAMPLVDPLNFASAQFLK